MTAAMSYLDQKASLFPLERPKFSNHVTGCGSVLTVGGNVEMDALVMDGKTLASGAVSAVRNIANPIQLARLVMEKVRTQSGVKFT